jgi:hypothetical protein
VPSPVWSGWSERRRNVAYDIEMDDPVGTIFRELEDRRVTQNSIALTYCFIMRQEPKADWAAINAAIVKRWKGKTALSRVKEMAWRYYEGKEQPSGK